MHDDPRNRGRPEDPGPRTERPRARSGARLAGAVLVACSVGLIGAGALATWARSSGTYVELGGHGSYLTEQYALTTDSTDWRATLLGWAGSVRLEVASESSSADLRRRRRSDRGRWISPGGGLHQHQDLGVWVGPSTKAVHRPGPLREPSAGPPTQKASALRRCGGRRPPAERRPWR